MEVIVVWYSVTNNGQPSGNQFCHCHSVTKDSFEDVCVMFLHRYFCLRFALLDTLEACAFIEVVSLKDM
jgi:hypothetical protein